MTFVEFTGSQVVRVLSHRGTHAPSAREISSRIEALDAEERASASDKFRRIALGVESPGELEDFIKQFASPRDAHADSGPRPLRSQLPSQAAGSELRDSGFHAYGSAAAVKIELDLLRTEADAPARYTVRIEGAKKRGERFDWAGKVMFQFTKRELPVVGAFLLGHGNSKVEFSNHGPNANKSLSAERQVGKIFLKLQEGRSSPVAIPLEPPEVHAWGELVLTALALNQPHVPVAAQLDLLRAIGRLSP